MATHTADDRYKYDDIYCNRTLDDWVQSIHRLGVLTTAWRNIPLKKGSFSYDKLCTATANILAALITGVGPDQAIWLAEAGIHSIYMCWKMTRPYDQDARYYRIGFAANSAPQDFRPLATAILAAIMKTQPELFP